MGRRWDERTMDEGEGYQSEGVEGRSEGQSGERTTGEGGGCQLDAEEGRWGHR